MSNSNYMRLGDCIRPVDVRNRDMISDKPMGINIDKFFMPSVANVVGTDLSNYKVVEKNQFACNLMHVGRDERLPIAILEQDAPIIVSPAYYVFEIKPEISLMPSFLMLWFKRPEFDRNAWFYTDADVRGGLDRDSFLDMEIPVPNIDEQRRIVAEYQAVEKRIANNEALIAKLEEAAQTIYKKMFVDDIDPENLPNGWSHRPLKEIVVVKGGKRLPKGEELTDIPNSHPYIKVADMSKARILELDDSFQYVEDDIQSSISRYNVSSGDVILSIVGTIGNVNIVGDSLDKANLTENCVKLVGKKEFSNLVYAFLTSTEGKKQIEQAIVGGVQSKLPIYNIEKLDLILPDTVFLNQFNSRISVINEAITLAIKENKELRKLSLLMHARLSS